MRAPLWITILAGALALVLIVYGIVLLGSIVTTGPNPSGGQTTEAPQTLLTGMESGSMVLGGPVGDVAPRTGEIATEPATTEPATAEPPPNVPDTTAKEATVDACPPLAEAGFAADAPLAAIGMIRLYIEPDVLAPTLGEFSAGQTFYVTADTAGVTALRRCELVWVRVRLTGGGMGWALAGALQAAPAAPVVAPPICPGGCATPTCVPSCGDVPCGQPCTDPCNLPCTQPCTTPCGVYSK